MLEMPSWCFYSSAQGTQGRTICYPFTTSWWSKFAKWIQKSLFSMSPLLSVFSFRPISKPLGRDSIEYLVRWKTRWHIGRVYSLITTTVGYCKQPIHRRTCPTGKKSFVTGSVPWLTSPNVINVTIGTTLTYAFNQYIHRWMEVVLFYDGRFLSLSITSKAFLRGVLVPLEPVEYDGFRPIQM